MLPIKLKMNLIRITVARDMQRKLNKPVVLDLDPMNLRNNT